jgi:hypothetical protein
MTQRHLPNPVPVAHLFPVLDAELITLLRSLSLADWNRPTPAKRWTVKDIVAHLLDGKIRTLSMQRDRYFGVEPEENIDPYHALTQWLNALNHDWVHATKRISPQMLIFLLEAVNHSVQEYFVSLPPFEESLFSVAWAGEETSFNWMHVAREYTEQWHHQQQIRDAIGDVQSALMTRRLFYPMIATLLRGLAHTYRHTDAVMGTSVAVIILGESGGTWYVIKTESVWELTEALHTNQQPVSVVRIPPNTAWKLFCKALSPHDAYPEITITGDTTLGEVALTMISVVA